MFLQVYLIEKPFRNLENIALYKYKVAIKCMKFCSDVALLSGVVSGRPYLLQSTPAPYLYWPGWRAAVKCTVAVNEVGPLANKRRIK